MMAILDEIKAYVPFNEQEIEDKKKFIDFINNNDDIFTRNNINGHITSSAWILNKEHNKVLMCYHNIYDSYSWLGGHADGNEDTLSVALKEIKEESGITDIKLIHEGIYSLEVLPVLEHIKRGQIVKAHYHYNLTYLFECDDSLPLTVNPNENSDLKWFSFNELEENVKEHNMYNNIYKKLIEKGAF